MNERARFVVLHAEGLYTITELAERFGISRKTAYKWLHRYEEAGLEGLADHSRAPHSSPRRTSAQVEQALLEERKRHPHWGPKKLIPYLRRRNPELALPAPSTVGALLKRNGLTQVSRPRRRPVHPGTSPLLTEAPHHVWTADFKGEFLTGDGRWCYPLTVSDAHTRYLLACYGLPSVRQEGAQPVFERLFMEHGLPTAIRTDNGSPFASSARCGLSRLSVWWTKLGIQHQRIQPGHPEQNGRHERMHRTLKAETTRPPGADLTSQQERFEVFREQFNKERPHEALGQETPASQYRPSPRTYPAKLSEAEYPGYFQVRRVSPGGQIRFRKHFVFVSEVLQGEQVGLEEVADGIWSVYFCELLLGRLSEETGCIV